MRAAESNRLTAAAVYVSLLANVILFYHRPLFSTQYVFPWDFRGVQLPMLSFLVDRLRAGHFALWNPYSYCGYPVFANIEACFFQPFILAAAWIAAHTRPESLPQLLEWVVALHIWIAGLGAYYLFRNLNAGPIAAWAGALIFETGGYFPSRTEHIGAILAVAWMPFAWLAVWKLRERFHPAWLAALGAALGMAVVGGFPQPTLAVYVSTAVWAIALAIAKLGRRGVLLYTAAGCALGLALSSVIFIPTAQLSMLSVAKYRAGWLGGGGGIYWQSFVSFLLPNHYHILDRAGFNGPGDRSFLYLYCSLAGFALAVIALWRARGRNTALMAAMGVFGALFALGENTPIWRLLYPLLPDRIRIGVHPEYTYCILTLAVAGLAAVGLNSLRARGVWKIAVGVLIAIDLFVTGSGTPMTVVSLKDEPSTTREAFAGNREALATVRALSFTESPPWRIDNLEGTTPDWPVQAPLTRVPSSNGVSPLALENIIQLRLFLHDGEPWGWYYPVAKPESPVLDLLNARYLATTVEAAPRIAALPKFQLAAHLPGYELFENRSALPRFFLVNEARTAKSLAEARAVIGSGIDLRRVAVTGSPVTLSANSAATGDVRTVSYEPDAIELAVLSHGTSLLVAAENDYPGWSAWVDGQPAPIIPTDIAFRGVVTPDGAHRVRMEFHPGILPLSLALTGMTGVLLLALALWRREPK